MKIYHSVKKYCQNTGEPIIGKEFKELRCDFTGEIIDNCYVSYKLNYGGSDACFGSSGKEYEFFQKHNRIYTYAHVFLSGEYHFFDEYVESDMMKKYLSSSSSYDEDLLLSFSDMCRASRIETASKLIDIGAITSNQLTIMEEWE